MKDTSFITVPSLSKWQHYKDRCPPWIKLHRDVLNDYEFSRLQDASKAHLLSIWLLASQLDNRLPNDSNWLAKRINATEEVDLESLVARGFIEIAHIDSSMLAPCKQNAIGETETETETETEGEPAMPETGSDTPPLETEQTKVANYLANEILNRDPKYSHLINGKRSKTVNGWSEDIEKLHRIDQRNWSDIWRVIRWCQSDQFWCKNILSGGTFRKQFSKLLLQMPAKGDASEGDSLPDYMQGVQ